jgi:hypothetical protein
MARAARCLALLILWQLLQGALHAQEAQTHDVLPADAEFFEKHVRPVLAQRCFACHSAEAKQKNKLRGGLLLDTRAGFSAGGDSGRVVVPGDLEKSRLVEAVRYANTDLQMPPAGKLPVKEIAALEAWVKRGAPFPADGAKPTENGAKRVIDIAAGKQFWSFQPLKAARLPVVRDSLWPQQRIDAFILARLEAAGLSPSVPAERRTLIRRTTFDLIGLPPGPEEVEGFLRDEAPDAYERLIERLLASPHYGERWGRFWLDLVRYADATPTWLSPAHNAHLYRDWVVQAFNEDLPYDQFVKRQLAADLLEDAAPADIAALGFLGLSPTYWKELMLDKEVIKGIVADEWEERINTIGGTFLGLTVACARCHDHKFDPITVQDYYGLAGVLASTRLIDRPLLPPAEAAVVARARERIAAIEAELKQVKAKKSTSPGDVQLAAELSARMAQIERDTPHFHAPLAHAVDDAALYVEADGPDQTKLVYQPGKPRDLPVFIRGNPSNLGQVVPRRFLKVLSSPNRRAFQKGSGRLELAEAIVGDAMPLAARVIVNRVWRHHFGRGLVETASNFGAQGARPTHLELLDDLAARFVRHGWSLKWLHREIMLSATYRQSSVAGPLRARNGSRSQPTTLDPDNLLLWRMNRRRLEVEAWRDAMMAVSGQLDRRVGGPAVEFEDPANSRRTLYGKIARRDLHDMLRLYDFPEPEAHSPSRELTITPLQQLFVLNGDFISRQSAALARQLTPLGRDDQRVGRAFELLFARPASESELSAAREYLAPPGNAAANETLWRQYAQVLLSSNEFMFVD